MANTPPFPQTKLYKLIGFLALSSLLFFIIALWAHATISAVIFFTLFCILMIWSHKYRYGMPYVLSKPYRILTVSLIFLFFGLLGIKKPQNTGELKPYPNNTINAWHEAAMPSKKQSASPVVRYKVKYNHTDIRYDSHPYLLVLIEPVDISKPKFKQTVRQVVRKVAYDYGAKINIDIYDDAGVLEMMNNSDEINKLNGKRLSKAQYKQLSRHYIAMYASGLEEMGIEHELSFFPSEYHADPAVEALRSTENFSAD